MHRHYLELTPPMIAAALMSGTFATMCSQELAVHRLRAASHRRALNFTMNMMIECREFKEFHVLAVD